MGVSKGKTTERVASHQPMNARRRTMASKSDAACALSTRAACCTCTAAAQRRRCVRAAVPVHSSIACGTAPQQG